MVPAVRRGVGAARGRPRAAASVHSPAAGGTL